jgi:hypothetical protein
MHALHRLGNRVWLGDITLDYIQSRTQLSPRANHIPNQNSWNDLVLMHKMRHNRSANAAITIDNQNQNPSSYQVPLFIVSISQRFTNSLCILNPVAD